MENHIQKMQYEMELRTYAPSTQKHYLSQIRLLENYSNKSCPLISPDEIERAFITVLKVALATAKQKAGIYSKN